MSKSKTKEEDDLIVKVRGERDRKLSLIAAGLPDDRQQLLDEGHQVITLYDRAVTAGDKANAKEAGWIWTAIIWKLNGGTTFGSIDVARALDKHCQSSLGVCPKWGQYGDFLLEHNGVRVWASYQGEPEPDEVDYQSVEFRVVDIDRPFISETGFMSSRVEPFSGGSVAEACGRSFAREVETGRDLNTGQEKPRKSLPMVKTWESSRGPEPIPMWLQLVEPAPCRVSFHGPELPKCGATFRCPSCGGLELTTEDIWSYHGWSVVQKSQHLGDILPSDGWDGCCAQLDSIGGFEGLDAGLPARPLVGLWTGDGNRHHHLFGNISRVDGSVARFSERFLRAYWAQQPVSLVEESLEFATELAKKWGDFDNTLVEMVSDCPAPYQPGTYRVELVPAQKKGKARK